MTPRTEKILIILFALHLVVMALILLQGLAITENTNSIADSLKDISFILNGNRPVFGR